VQVAALIDEALRKMGGVSSSAQPDSSLLHVDIAAGAAAAASGWDSNTMYGSADAGDGSYSSSASSDEEVEVAGGLR
jgi:hypothetical protein